MPNTKSAQKQMRASAKRRSFNLVTIKKYKEAVKTVRSALAGKKKDEAAKALANAYAQVDKALKKHVIKRNKAARLKSRLAKAIAKA